MTDANADQPTTSPPIYRVTLTGGAMVGKSSLIARFVQMTNGRALGTLAGTDVQAHTLHIGNLGVELETWDTPGRGRFYQVEAEQFADVHAIGLVYDVAMPSSFFDLFYLQEQFSRLLPRVPMMVIGAKADLLHAIPADEARGWAQGLEMPFALASAFTGEGVAEVFTALADLAIRELERRKGVWLGLGSQARKAGG
jgi:small GTP-binding protein